MKKSDLYVDEEDKVLAAGRLIEATLRDLETATGCVIDRAELVVLDTTTMQDRTQKSVRNFRITFRARPGEIGR